MRLRGIGCFASCVALIDIGQIGALARGGLHRLGKPPNLGAIVGAGQA
jgi:hypothetical protein